jgi:transglutaminase-like putative cysteine protease
MRKASAWQFLLALSIGSALLLAAIGPRSRAFEFEYIGVANQIPEGTQQLDFWMPAPHSDAYQDIADLQVESKHPYDMTVDRLGNRILHIRVDHPSVRSLQATLRFRITRREHRQELLLVSERNVEPPAGELTYWLQPDRLVPLDNQIRARANQVVEEAHARTDMEKARAIYNHIVATVKYDKTGKGWGRGDIYYACENRRGNCTDFHAIFIGYARALGIPARFAIGFPIPAEHGAGRIAGYHCWAEFYAKGLGWVPIDASEAAKDPSRRDYFFGAHDENRVEFSLGRDLRLAPAQSGDPLNYFVYPYAEADGKPLAGIDQEVTFKDVTQTGPGARRVNF